MVTKETPVLNLVRTVVLLLFFGAVAFVIWYCCMRLIGNILLHYVPWLKKDVKMAKNVRFFCTYCYIIIYSWAVIQFNKQFSKAAAYIVWTENHKFATEHEDSSIQKSYTLGFVNSYLGMLAASFYYQNFSALTFLLSTVLMMKQLIMKIIAVKGPHKKIPKQLGAHRVRVE